MAEAGVELIADYHQVAVVGIFEVLHKFRPWSACSGRLLLKLCGGGGAGNWLILRGRILAWRAD